MQVWQSRGKRGPSRAQALGACAQDPRLQSEHDRRSLCPLPARDRQAGQIRPPGAPAVLALLEAEAIGAALGCGREQEIEMNWTKDNIPWPYSLWTALPPGREWPPFKRRVRIPPPERLFEIVPRRSADDPLAASDDLERRTWRNAPNRAPRFPPTSK